jgi:hypothetical protein
MKMKKKIYLFATILLSAVALSLSSCLKDSRFVDLSKVGTIVEFPTGGQTNFGQDAETSSADTIIQQYAVNIASPTVPTTATTVTLSVNDPAIISAYNAAYTAVSYLPMPQGSYTVSPTSLTVPAGQRSAVFTVTLYKNQLDPSKSYMLPVAIKSAGGLNISGNMGVHYFHFIGNPFAGSYTWNFYRYNNATGTGPTAGGSFYGASAGQVTIYPVTPTEFQVVSGYYTQQVNYDVSFTQPDATHFENFQIVLNASDIANNWTPNGIALTQPAVFGYGITPAYAANTPYTYAQALAFFTFQYQVNTGNPRFLIDNYVHN